MPRGEYQSPPGYLTLGEAEERLKVNRVTIRRMVKAGRLSTYADPRNGRVRLLRVEDVERLERPVPAE